MLSFSSARVEYYTSHDSHFDKLVLLPAKCSKESPEANLTVRFPLFLVALFKILPLNAGKPANRLQDSDPTSQWLRETHGLLYQT